MTRIIAAAALVFAVGALPLAACPYSKTKSDQSVSTQPSDGGTVVLKPRTNS